MRQRSQTTRSVMAAGALLTAVWMVTLTAQFVPDLPRPLESLRGKLPPAPPNLGDFVRNRQAALVLGKALFWDVQAGSDDQTACATCHHLAGADSRVKNQVHPNVDGFGRTLSTTNFTMAQAPTGANYVLKLEDFPFHQLADPANRGSAVKFSSNDVVGSQGVVKGTFNGFDAAGNEKVTVGSSTVFRVGVTPNRAQVRQATGRNAPTVINAAFNFRNFWDGRANHFFNGVNPFGPRDLGAVIWVYKFNGTCLALMPERIALENASAASQAVGPATNDVEMSATNRKFPDIGRKLLPRRALAMQRVDPTDSVLGPYVDASGYGLNVTYRQLVEQAFHPMYWEASTLVPQSTYKQIEGNFSLFWGLAIQIYESTLVSDQTPLDLYLDGLGALSADEKAGLEIFSTKGHCINCHGGAELTNAAREQFLNKQVGGLVEHMMMGDGETALYDSGFYNIGVTPSANDPLQGGTDPFGNPLSFARQFKLVLGGGAAADPLTVNTCSFEVSPCASLTNPNIRDAIDGAAKTPTLRNVALTAPYFHNGGYRTLEEVVEFYNRGGNVRQTATGDTTGLGTNASNLAFDIQPLGLTAQERAQLVAFLRALTDPRVRNESAPFDHPELRLPAGHPGDPLSTPIDGSGRALDESVVLPAVGAAGRSGATPPLPQLQPFDPPAAGPPLEGLSAAFSFNEGTGTVVTDRSGKANHGKISGAAWTTEGVYGGALAFDGVDDWVTVASSASLAVTNRFTLSAWAKPSALSGWRTVLLKESPNGMSYALYAHDNAPWPAAYARINLVDRPVTGTAPLPTNQWTYLAATYDGATFRLYVGDSLRVQEVNSVPLTGSAGTSASSLRIGGNATWLTEFFSGIIDEVRVYNRALTAAEIDRDMRTPIQ